MSVLTRVPYFKMQVTFEFEEMYVVELFSIYIYLPEKQNSPSPLKKGVRIKRVSAEQGPLYIKDTVMIGMARKY